MKVWEIMAQHYGLKEPESASDLDRSIAEIMESEDDLESLISIPRRRRKRRGRPKKVSQR